MSAKNTLIEAFKVRLKLPDDAVAWLLDLWDFIQVFDDYADGDPVEELDRDHALIAALVKMPSNRFYQQHQHWLVPAVAQMCMKWMASDLAERKGEADERSYMWRAGYYDVVMMVVSLVHGPSSQNAWAALSLYGEAVKDYLSEFDRA